MYIIFVSKEGRENAIYFILREIFYFLLLETVDGVRVEKLSSFHLLSGVSAIQNDKTSSRVSRENIVLSASAYTGPEKTSSQLDESQTFQRTVPAFQLESSRNDYDRQETRIVFKDTSHESVDELTTSKHVAHIDGNNIEAKASEYYQ